MSVIGSRASYIVALNRLQPDFREAKDVFSDWFSVDTTGYDLKTIDVPHLDRESMDDLVRGGNMPSDLNGELRYLAKVRIAAWKDKVHKQLETTGLFPF